LGYEPNELPTAPPRDFVSAKVVIIFYYANLFL